MLVDKHPDYKKEKEFLDMTCSCMDEEIEHMSDEIHKFNEEIHKLKGSVGGVFDNELHVKQTIFHSMERKHKELVKAKDKPYFGRIDFKELGKDEYETFYIGKTSLVRRVDEKRLIIDWRAPIASLYYSGELGDVMYTAPDGLIMGDLKMKRQYEIDNRELKNIFDKGLTPMDEYLQSALWQKKDNKLKDIVTTIQSEQNDIIRADKDKVIIVQGVAGSGKTTIVLHRIAYLMYTYQDIFAPDKLLILVPNKLFLNYISDVLPDLGVEEINQSTFEDLSISLLGREYKITDIEFKYLKLLDHKKLSKENRDKLKWVSQFKGSMALKAVIDKYIEELSQNIIPQCEIKINGFTVYTYEELRNLFYKDYSYLPLIQRIDRIKKYIEANIKDRVKALKDSIIEEYDFVVEKTKKEINKQEELRKKLIDIYNQRDAEIDNLSKGVTSAVKSYFNQWLKVGIDGVYKEIMTDRELLTKYGDNLRKEDVDFIAKHSMEIFDRGEIEREDLAPLLYLKLKLYGLELKGRFNHIVVDEAQDYSNFQMYMLKVLSSNNSFTIVGDLSQGIHSYKGINNWQELIQQVFKNNDKEYLTLTKCYRSTIDIMNFANEVLKKHGEVQLTLAEPVLRSGDKPSIIKKNNTEEIIGDMSHKIKNLKGEGYKSIAIICKTEEESKMVYNKLKKVSSEDIHLITDKDTRYNGGIVIVPAYVAKGLEFDAVMIYNLTKENYPVDELHMKLVYVALTRPLHKLFIYYTGEISNLI